MPLKVTFINGELSEWERLETAIGVSIIDSRGLGCLSAAHRSPGASESL